MKIGQYMFQDPWILALLAVIPIYLFYYFLFLTKRKGKIKSSTFHATPNSMSFWLHLPLLFSMVGLSLLIMGLARPQMDVESENYIEEFAEGIDIVIAFDASSSMLATDFKPNRLEASKAVAQEFVASRKNDRIGLVVYEGESFTQCPLTTDQDVLLKLFEEVETGMIEGGTAIGMGLATAVNRLRESDATSKVIILLTDGVNTHGKIHPVSAAEIALEFGIRVYTIGVGTNGKARSPVAIDHMGNYVYDYKEVEIDEEILKKIAKTTKGKYFRATDNSSLEDVYEEIDQLEKDKIKTIEYQVDIPEEFFNFVLTALICLLISAVLSKVILRTTP
ncbi:MAG: VWA domain-containing protein [Flavobacteriales bacterium]|nr:VWA domain-containing protein [Flavobacteriales bacterium]